VPEADEVVRELLAAGFSQEQITVISSDTTVQKHFAEYEHEDPAGSYALVAWLMGGLLGAILAGSAAFALVSFTELGGVALLAAVGVATWGGGVAGGLIGAMMTRGVEKEPANYYDQAVMRGKILVAAEQLDPKRHGALERATQILARHGARPLPLAEG
jgi:hypothetical protein